MDIAAEVTAQQEVGSDLGSTRQLVPQSKKRVSNFCTWRSYPGAECKQHQAWHFERVQRDYLQQTHTH